MIGLLNYARRSGRSHLLRSGRIGLVDYARQKSSRIDLVDFTRQGLGRIGLRDYVRQIGLTDYTYQELVG